MINIIERFFMVTKNQYPKYYAFTWNPNPLSFIWNEEDPILLLKEHLKILRKYKQYIKYVVPEFSDNYKLHYHGVVMLSNDTEFANFYENLKPIRRKGFVKLVHIIRQSGYKRWVKYTGETWARTKQILKIEVMAYEDLSISILNDATKGSTTAKPEASPAKINKYIIPTDDEYTTDDDEFCLP